jgi:hypothetical protein
VFVASLLFALAACGGGQQSTHAAQDARAAVEQGPPPVPTEPAALVHEGAAELVSADLSQLRRSKHFPTLNQWFQHYGCVAADPAHVFFGRTDRALLASYGASAGEPAARRLLVLRGRYEAGDPQRALAEAQKLLGYETTDAISERTEGRFQLFTQGKLSAFQPSAGLLVLGDSDKVAAALAVADGKQKSVNAQALFPGVDAQWLASHTVAAITQVDERSAQRLGGQLSGIGGRRLGEGLSQSSAALSLALAESLQLDARVLYSAPEAADAAASGLRAVIGRANLVMRLTGMPSSLERATVTTEGERMNVSLTVTEAELRQLIERIEPMLRSEAPPCGTQASSPAPADTAPAS